MEVLQQSASEIKVQTPAKINLFLRIRGQLDSGYHDLVSLMSKISLYDQLTFHKRRKPGIALTCKEQPQLEGDDNLIVQVAKRMLPSGAGLDVRLVKSIPMGAGLGGGSSDAAATIRVLNRLFDLRWSEQACFELAAELGADVPFFLLSQNTAMATGSGTILRPIHKLPRLELVLVYPKLLVSSAWAYQAYAKQSGKCRSRQNSLTLSGSNDTNFSILERFSVAQCVAKAAYNDLEKVVSAQYGEIIEIKRALEKAKALTAVMSGSGSSVFGLYAGQKELRQGEDQLQRKSTWWIRSLHTLGPSAVDFEGAL